MMKAKGQALVEMAIAILLLFLLVFGIFQFGWLMYIKNTLNNAARAGVRQAIVMSPLNDYDYADFTTRHGSDLVQQKIFDSLNYVNKNSVSATIRIVNASNSTHNPAAAGDTVTINLLLSDVPSFVPGFITVGTTLTGQASMRYE